MDRKEEAYAFNNKCILTLEIFNCFNCCLQVTKNYSRTSSRIPRYKTKGKSEKRVEGPRKRKLENEGKKELSHLCVCVCVAMGERMHECIWKFTNLEKGFTYVLVHH